MDSKTKTWGLAIGAALLLVGGILAPRLINKGKEADAVSAPAPVQTVTPPAEKPLGEEVAAVQVIEADLKPGDTPWSFTAKALKDLGLEPSLQLKATQLVVRDNNVAVDEWKIVGKDRDTRLLVGHHLSVKVDDLIALAKYESAVGQTTGSVSEEPAPSASISIDEDGTETKTVDGVTQVIPPAVESKSSSFSPILPAIMLAGFGMVAFMRSRKSSPKEGNMHRTLMSLVLVSVLGFVGCESDCNGSPTGPDDSGSATKAVPQPTATPATPASPAASPSPDAKVSCVHVSASSTQATFECTNNGPGDVQGHVSAWRNVESFLDSNTQELFAWKSVTIPSDQKPHQISIDGPGCFVEYHVSGASGPPASASDYGKPGGPGILYYAIKGEGQPCKPTPRPTPTPTPSPTPSPAPPLSCETQDKEINKGGEYNVRVTNGVAPFEYWLNGVPVTPVAGQNLVRGIAEKVGNNVVQIRDSVRPARLTECGFKVIEQSQPNPPNCQPKDQMIQAGSETSISGQGAPPLSWFFNNQKVGDGAKMVRLFEQPGIFTFTLKDASGQADVCRVQVVKVDEPPSPRCDVQSNAKINEKVKASGSSGTPPYRWSSHGQPPSGEGPFYWTQFGEQYGGTTQLINLVDARGKSATCPVKIEQAPPTCEEVNLPKGVVVSFGDQGGNATVVFRIENAGNWEVVMYATSSKEEYETDRPDYRKTGDAETLACGKIWSPTLSYPWRGHPSKYWWVVIKRDGRVFHKSPAKINPYLS